MLDDGRGKRGQEGFDDGLSLKYLKFNRQRVETSVVGIPDAVSQLRMHFVNLPPRALARAQTLPGAGRLLHKLLKLKSAQY